MFFAPKKCTKKRRKCPKPPNGAPRTTEAGLRKDAGLVGRKLSRMEAKNLVVRDPGKPWTEESLEVLEGENELIYLYSIFIVYI